MEEHDFCDAFEDAFFGGNQQAVFIRKNAVRTGHTTIRRWFKAFDKSLEPNFL